MGNPEFKPDQNEVNEDISEEQAEKIGEQAVDVAEKVASDDAKDADALIENAGPDVEPIPLAGEPVSKPLEFKDLPEFGTPDPDAKNETENNDAEYQEKVNGEIQKQIIGLYSGDRIAEGAKLLEKEEFMHQCTSIMQRRVERLVDRLDQCMKADNDASRGLLVMSSDTGLIATLKAFDKTKKNPEDVVKRDDDEFGTYSLEGLVDEENSRFSNYRELLQRAVGVEQAAREAAHEINDETLASIAGGLEVLADNLEPALTKYYDFEHNKKPAEKKEPEGAEESLAKMRSIVTKLGGEAKPQE